MNVKSITPYAFLVFLFLAPTAYSKSDFENFITFSPLAIPPDVERNKQAAKLLYGTWVLKSDVEGGKQASTKPGFIHFLTSGDLITSESYFNDGGWFNTTSKHHVVGSWEFNAEKSLPISQSVISEVVSYIEHMRKKVDEQDLLVMQRFPEVNKLRVDQRGDFLRKHQAELKDIFSDKSVDRRGLRKATDILPLLRQGLADKQSTLYFGGMRTIMSPEFDSSENYIEKRDYDGFFIKGSTSTYLTGKKIYLSDLRRNGMREMIFEKPPIDPSAYPEDKVGYYQNKLQGEVKTRANKIYEGLNRVCAQWMRIADKIPENAYESCRKQKDALLSLGVTKIEEYKFIDERAVKIPDGLNRLIDFSKSPVDQTLEKEGFPFLGYCFNYSQDGHNEAMLERLSKQKYGNAAFRLSITPKISIKPANWPQQLFESYSAMQLSSLVHLRPDGIIGLSRKINIGTNYNPKLNTVMYYDPQNSWQYSDNKIQLKFANGKVSRTLYVGKSLYSSPAVRNSGGNDFYDEGTKLHLAHWDIHFIFSDAQLSGDQKHMNPTYREALKKAPRNGNECAYLDSGPQNPGTGTGTVTNIINNPKENGTETASLANPFTLSEYAHFRVVPNDPNAPIAPEVKALWANGFYIHLKEDGNFGFNTDKPGSYIYLPVNRWENKNGVFTLTLDKVVYSFTLPPTKETANETTLKTIDSTWNAFEMTYVTKEKGVR